MIEFVERWDSPNEYLNDLEVMNAIHAQTVSEGIPGKIIITRHSPVFTCGLTDTPPDDKWIKTDRGGGYTYHDEGQIMCYPIISLHFFRLKPQEYNEKLYSWVQSALRAIQVNTELVDSGLWVKGRKVAFFGTRILKGVSKHGFFINLNTDLTMFNGFAPCGKESVIPGNLNLDSSEVVNSLKKSCIFSYFDRPENLQPI